MKKQKQFTSIDDLPEVIMVGDVEVPWYELEIIDKLGRKIINVTRYNRITRQATVRGDKPYAHIEDLRKYLKCNPDHFSTEVIMTDSYIQQRFHVEPKVNPHDN